MMGGNAASECDTVSYLAPFERNTMHRRLGLLTPNWGGGVWVGLRWGDLTRVWGVS